MPERIGDKPIEERVNEGQCELSHFWPDESTRARDALSAMEASPMRNWVYFNELKPQRKAHQSTRRESQYLETIELPDYVINTFIKIDNRSWNYRMSITHTSSLRRVFVMRDQALELNIEETL